MDSITLKKLSGGPRDCISTDGVLGRIKKHKRILERHIIVKCSGSVFLQMSPLELSMQPGGRGPVAAWLWSALTSVQDTAGEGSCCSCCCAPAANTQSHPEFANMKIAIATKFLPNKAFE